MFTLSRWFATTSVLGTVLVAAACTSPVEEEIAQPAEEETAAVAESDEATEGDEAADADDLETTSSALPVDEDGTFSDEVQLEDQALLRHDRRRVCDRRDEWHCRRHHRGWRWVSYGRGWRGGDVRDHRDERGGRRGELCCVRYRPRWHR